MDVHLIRQVKHVRRYATGVIAFCTIVILLFPGTGAAQPLATHERNLSVYKTRQLAKGARDFRVLAQLYYRQAIFEIEAGKREEAVRHLQTALALQPTLPDACFTLARLKALSLDGESLLYLLRGIELVAHDFEYQSLLAANGILAALLVLIVVAIIFGIAMVIKYLPFSAHRLTEFLQTRFNAAHSRLAAYLVLLIPFALFPGFITGFAIMLIITWVYLSRREKGVVFLLTALLICTGFFANSLKKFTPLTDPRSLTATIATANVSGGDQGLLRILEKTPAGHPELKKNKNLALGLLSLRADDLFGASDYFLKTIASDPQNTLAYINLSNVYYLQGEYEKSLEGYIKAEAIDSLDAIGQYNLGQAYIKTLLMAKSSQALNKASRAGIDEVKSAYAPEALGALQVFPAPFSSRQLWHTAFVEGSLASKNFILDIYVPLAHFSPRMSAWILLLALLFAIVAGRAARASWLTFQCSNCGKLTCNSCCNNDRGIILCGDCASAIEGVSSDRVIEALLRQRRQARALKNRKLERVIVYWLPGMRNIYHDNLFGGIVLAILFGMSIAGLWSRGLIIENWKTLPYSPSPWHWYLPTGMLLLSYAISILKKQKQKPARSRTMTARTESKDAAPNRQKKRRKQAAL